MKIECTTQELEVLQGKSTLMQLTAERASAQTQASYAQDKAWELTEKIRQVEYKVTVLERENALLRNPPIPSSNGEGRLQWLSVAQRDMVNKILEALPYNKINAIKFYRELTGLGLKEAKDAIEILTNKLGNKID